MGHTPDDFQFSVLYVSSLTDARAIQMELLKWECFWIFKLHLLMLEGLNVTNEFFCFL